VSPVSVGLVAGALVQGMGIRSQYSRKVSPFAAAAFAQILLTIFLLAPCQGEDPVDTTIVCSADEEMVNYYNDVPGSLKCECVSANPRSDCLQPDGGCEYNKQCTQVGVQAIWSLYGENQYCEEVKQLSDIVGGDGSAGDAAKCGALAASDGACNPNIVSISTSPLFDSSSGSGNSSGSGSGSGSVECYCAVAHTSCTKRVEDEGSSIFSTEPQEAAEDASDNMDAVDEE